MKKIGELKEVVKTSDGAGGWLTFFFGVYGYVVEYLDEDDNIVVSGVGKTLEGARKDAREMYKILLGAP